MIILLAFSTGLLIGGLVWWLQYYFLNQNYQFALSVIDQMPGGFVVIDSKGQISATNTAFRSLRSRLPVDALQKMVADGQSGRELTWADRLDRVSHRSIRQKETFDLYFFHPLPKPKPDSDASLVQPALEPIRTMALGLAHHLKNPITSIKMVLQMGDAHHHFDLEQLKGIILFEVERLDKIVADFLHFADPEKVYLKPENMLDIVKEVDDIVRKQYSDRKISLVKDLYPVPKLNLDRKKVVQLMLNLIVNAIDALPEYGGQIEIGIKKRGKHVDLKVCNEGDPIQPDHQPKLFWPFFTTKQSGVGLGLAICQKIAEFHHATISCHLSSSGKTCFTVKFPIETLKLNSKSETEPQVQVKD